MAQPARPAATLILLRDAAAGPEVLMIQRSTQAVFVGGAWVFPGGALDPADSDPCFGHADALLPWRVAAVRECFEEAGVLLLDERDGRVIGAERAAALAHHRFRSFAELVRREGLRVRPEALAWQGHWITAPGRSRRYDTRFFVAEAPPGQEGRHDAGEAIHLEWIRPAEALARADRGEIELVTATRATLEDLAQFPTAGAAVEAIRGRPAPDTHRACWAVGREGRRLFRRGDAPYFEIHWSDPEETGETSCDLVPGVPKRLDRWVRRVIAPNPSAMTGPGTNTYAIGHDELAIVDPGPTIPSHIEAISKLGRIRWILCTHTHVDHSPAALALKAATGAQVIGRPAPPGQDETFRPDVVPEQDQTFDLGGLRLRALHTPGHASNHVCWLLEDTRMLFTGDHVMQGSTVVIDPPDGDMRAYLRSLEGLLAEELAILAPGHGYLIGEPHREVRRLIAHRMAREQKVMAALARLREASIDELLPLVYGDVPARMHRWAARSLAAHLDKLVAEGAARTAAGRYTA